MTPVPIRIHGSNHWRALLGGGFLVPLGLATVVLSVRDGFDGSLLASAVFVLVLGGVPMFVVLRRQQFVRADGDGYRVDVVEGRWADATSVRLVGSHVVACGWTER